MEDDSVYIFRLKAGYDVVAKVKINDGGHDIILFNPFRPMYTSHPETGVAIVQLIEWLSFEMFEDTSSCVLNLEDVLIFGKAAETMTNLYDLTLEGVQKKKENGQLQSKIRTLNDIFSDQVEDTNIPTEVPKRKFQ